MGNKKWKRACEKTSFFNNYWVLLFWVKMILGNHFHPNPHVWLQRKIQFSENHLPVDQNLRLWPGNEFTLSFSLQFISGSRKTHSNTERKNAETQNAQQHRESERKNKSSDPFSGHRELRSSHRDLRAQNAQQHRESERKNPLLRSTSRRWRRVQPDDHRPDQRPI